MKPWALVPFIAFAAAAAGQDSPLATRLSLPDPAFRSAAIEPAEGAPSRFRVALERDMPTPGFSWEVDAVETDPSAGRIVVRVTERRPQGMVAQVITPTRLTIPLGPLAPGSYTMEIRVRPGPGGEYRLVHAAVLSAF